MTRGRALVGFLLCCVVLIVGASPASTESRSADRLDAFVAGQMDRANVPGVAYAVVGPRGIEHDATFGVDGNGHQVTPSTPFLWGSVAKPVTATLVVQLADAGALELDAPVSDYLPGFAMADDAARTITVRQLLTHTSGIPERLDLTDRYDAGRRPGDIVTDLEGTQLVGPVGQEHAYSSVNYILLAAIVEEVTGQEFADVLRQRLLAPASMGTAITTAGQAAERLPSGHRYVFGQPLPFRTGFAPAGLGSGYLGGTVEDLAAFARVNLPGSAVLTADQRARLHASQTPTGERRAYGLGWRTWPVFGSDEPMVWHAGAVPGFQTAIVLLPGQDRAVVVLQNAYGTFQESQLLDTAWGLASMLSGAQPELHGVEPLYAVLLVALSTICLALSAALIWSTRGLGRPRAHSSRRRTVIGLAGWLIGLLALGGGLLALPRAFGVPMSQVWLWAPDIAGLVDIALGMTALLAAGRGAVALRAFAGGSVRRPLDRGRQREFVDQRHSGW